MDSTTVIDELIAANKLLCGLLKRAEKHIVWLDGCNGDGSPYEPSDADLMADIENLLTTEEQKP